MNKTNKQNTVQNILMTITYNYNCTYYIIYAYHSSTVSLSQYLMHLNLPFFRPVCVFKCKVSTKKYSEIKRYWWASATNNKSPLH